MSAVVLCPGVQCRDTTVMQCAAQGLGHSSGYDSTDEEAEPVRGRGGAGLRQARSEEFLDRRAGQEDNRRAHRYWSQTRLT